MYFIHKQKIQARYLDSSGLKRNNNNKSRNTNDRGGAVND